LVISALAFAADDDAMMYPIMITAVGIVEAWSPKSSLACW